MGSSSNPRARCTWRHLVARRTALRVALRATRALHRLDRVRDTAVSRRCSYDVRRCQRGQHSSVSEHACEGAISAAPPRASTRHTVRPTCPSPVSIAQHTSLASIRSRCHPLAADTRSYASAATGKVCPSHQKLTVIRVNLALSLASARKKSVGCPGGWWVAR